MLTSVQLRFTCIRLLFLSLSIFIHPKNQFTHLPFLEHITPVLRDVLDWQPMPQRIPFKIAALCPKLSNFKPKRTGAASRGYLLVVVIVVVHGAKTEKLLKGAALQLFIEKTRLE